MTRAGFLALAIPLIAMSVAGFSLALYARLPEPEPEQLTCEEWFAHPQSSGTYAIEGCEVDVGDPLWWSSAGNESEVFDRAGIAALVIPVTLPNTSVEDPRTLYLATKDLEIGHLVERITRDSQDSPEFVRALERYDAQLLSVRPVVGRVVDSGAAYDLVEQSTPPGVQFWVIDATPESAPPRMWEAVGFALLVASLFIGIPLFFAQRRWKRKEKALRGEGTARPQTF